MENEIKDKWNEIITYMRDTYNINGVLFRTWINPLQLFLVIMTQLSLQLMKKNRAISLA